MGVFPVPAAFSYPYIAATKTNKMKTLLFPALLFAFGFSHGQGTIPISKEKAKALTTPPAAGAAEDAGNVENKINKGINFGVSLGFNTVFDKLYEARISPLDNHLLITSLPRTAFLISTGLSVPLTHGSLGGKYYRKLDNNGAPFGDVYYVPYGLCFVATVNLVTFNSAGNGSVFNQKIDGGLGLGYRINDDLQLALTYEMISYKQPREFLFGKEGTTLTQNGETVTSINPDNNDYFHDKYMPSISLKFFYLIKGKPTN